MADLADDIMHALRKKSWEVRVRKGRTTYVPHRFPVKGGLSASEVMAGAAMARNNLLARLRDG